MRAQSGRATACALDYCPPRVSRINLAQKPCGGLFSFVGRESLTHGKTFMTKHGNLRKELEANAAKLRQEIESCKAIVKESRARLARIEKQLARIKTESK